MSTINKLLAAFLLLQIVLIGYLYSSRPETANATVSFLPGVEVGQVRQLQITDEEGRTISLIREQNDWHIAGVPAEEGPYYRADADKIEHLLQKIIDLQSNRLVTRTKSSQNRLKVGNVFVRKLSLGLTNDETRTLYLGTSPSYNTIHVRLADANTVFLVDDFSTWEAAAEVKDWWDNQYLKLVPAELSAVEISNEHGTVGFLKGADDSWQLAGGPAAEGNDSGPLSQKIEEFVARVGRLTIDRYDSELTAERFGIPAVSITLRANGEDMQLSIGQKDEESGNYPVKSSDNQFYAWAVDFNVQHLFDVKRQDYLTATAE